MNISFYNGVSGMMAYQEGMDQISHNIANTNTAGYKPSRTAFDDLLYTRMAVNGEEDRLTGHGVRAAGSELIFRQGPVLQTGNALDCAILGEGFFSVERPDGSVEYTRSGAFDISVEGKKGYLVTSDGSYVLDGKGKRIDLERDGDSGLFDLEGLSDRLGVYTFPNPYGLAPSSGSCFQETEASGEADDGRGRRRTEEKPYQLVSGALEQSGVDLADEMVNVMITQKAFQFNAKMVQTADQVEEIVNNLR